MRSNRTKILFTFFVLLLITWVVVVQTSNQSGKRDVRNLFSKKEISKIMQKVCDYQIVHLAKWGEDSSWIRSTSHRILGMFPVSLLPTFRDTTWLRATFNIGILATYYTTHETKYLNRLMRWADKNNWMLGADLHNPDDQACGQVYLELYFLKKDPEMIENTQSTFDKIMENHKRGREEWSWSDTLFMAPPTLARLGAATGEKKYFDFMNKMYWDTVEFLFDKEEGLFYRDAQYVPHGNSRIEEVENRKKIFWSRGNGWVMGGIVRILQYLPEDDPYHNRFIQLLQTMTKSITKMQGDDGLWRTNLLNPVQFPAPETSGTAFFCYAIAWGIDQGYLDRETYLPVVKKAWRGLVNAVHPNGKLGWVQLPAHEPGHISPEDTQEYGVGAFLLAGSEVIKLNLSP